MKKTFKVVMLPTEKASKIGDIVSNNDGLLALVIPWEHGKNMTTEGAGDDKMKVQHLYIISDEEPKEGDFGYDNNKSTVERVTEHTYLPHYNPKKKIIALTDKSLFPNSWLNESFINDYIKAYNEGKPITEVDLEMEHILKVKGNADCFNEYDYKIKTRPDGSVIVHQDYFNDFKVKYNSSHLDHHDHIIENEKIKFHVLNGGSLGHAESVALRIVELINNDKDFIKKTLR